MFDDVKEGKPEGEQPLHFFYNREERLKNAPDIVKEFYNGGVRPPRGFKAIFSNKANKFMLFTLIILIAFAWIYTGISNKDTIGKIGDIQFEIKAFNYDESVYTTIKVLNKKADEKSAPVKIDADIFGINADNQIINKESLSLIYRDGEEFFRTKYDDKEITRIEAIITIGSENQNLAVDVSK